MKIYASVGGTTLAEYTEFNHTVPTWTKSYTYLGSTQLATVTPNGTGGEYVEFNHPDRLGTKLQTNQAGGTSYEQNTLPFGTALNAESTGSTNKRFTSYDRSNATGLDYAINRTYDSKQGRFTQVDPIGMQAVDLNIPQTLNLYTYCGNDPINYTDPSGLFFGRLFKWIGKHLKKIFAAVAVALAVVAVVAFPWSAPFSLKAVLGLVSALAGAASSVLDLAGLKTASKVFGFIAMVTGIAALGFEVKDAWKKLKESQSKVFSFADDPLFVGELLYVEVKISFAERIYQKVNNFLGGFADGLLFSLPSYIDQKRGIDRGTDYNSPDYNAGSWIGTASAAAVTGGGVKAVQGLGAKLAIHGAHHPFPVVGKLAHVQLNVWEKGVRNAKPWVRRIALPSRKNFKDIVIWQTKK